MKCAVCHGLGYVGSLESHYDCSGEDGKGCAHARFPREASREERIQRLEEEAALYDAHRGIGNCLSLDARVRAELLRGGGG
jgi:hypothetical protein